MYLGYLGTSRLILQFRQPCFSLLSHHKCLNPEGETRRQADRRDFTDALNRLLSPPKNTSHFSTLKCNPRHRPGGQGGGKVLRRNIFLFTVYIFAAAAHTRRVLVN